MIRKALLPIALLGLLAGCSEEKTEVHQEVIRPVKVVEVAPSSAIRKLEYSGTVRARSETVAGFRVAGKIIERKVDIGDRVAAGDLIARLDATDYELSVKSAEAALTAAERGVETAALTLDRARQLLEARVAPKSQLDQAELTYNQAVANRDAARAQLDQAKNQVGYAELQADRPGIITAIHADAGQVVAAGAPVVGIALDGEKEVSIAVPETDIFAFKPGKPVAVSFWSARDLTLEGRVREVAGSADAASRTFAVRISLPADERVLLGMTASVDGAADTGQPFFAVPLTALARGADGKDIVWTVDPAGETAHARAVKLGAFSEAGVKVTEGLTAGDLVVVAGTQFMTENLKVKLARAQVRHAAQTQTPSQAASLAVTR